MANEDAKRDDNFRPTLLGVTDDSNAELRNILVDSTTGRLKVSAVVTGATDDDAIHDNVNAEISAITEKVTPIDADLIVIEDSAASNAKKRVQVGNLPYPTTGPFTGYSAYVLSDVLNTVSKTEIFNLTIPANDIADGDLIIARWPVAKKQSSGGTVAVVQSLAYGADSVDLASKNVFTNAGDGQDLTWLSAYRHGDDLILSTGLLLTQYSLQGPLNVNATAWGTDSFNTASSGSVTITNPGFAAEKDITLSVTFDTAHADCYIKASTMSGVTNITKQSPTT